ncbi:MAG: hypothetical protein R3Y24_05815 [Eubacteriales bacterium]
MAKDKESSDGKQSSGTVDTDVVSESSEIVEVASENFETEKHEDAVLILEETIEETEKSSDEISGEELKETNVSEAKVEVDTVEIKNTTKQSTQANLQEEQIYESSLNFTVEKDILTYNSKDYSIIEVDGGDRSGSRSNNVAVDIGFGDRVCWALTNEYGQLVYVLAEQITLQNDETEPVTSSGRYYSDEANVPGTEHADLDQGDVTADSLGGVANAYNITPQDSTLNRHGDQAYMESAIRDAGGCADFVATITYTETDTQIPSKYKYVFTLMGNVITDEFDNVNPDDYNVENNVYDISSADEEVAQDQTVAQEPVTTVVSEEGNLSSVDTNGNGKVTISGKRQR